MSEQTQTTETTTTTQTVTDEVVSDSSTVKQMLDALLDISAKQATSARELHRSLRKLSVEVEREHKKQLRSSKPRRTVRQRPVKVSKEMASFLTKQGVQSEGDIKGYTRQAMMKAVSAYIKSKELQLEENRKSWKADKTLVKLFSLDAKETFTFMNINGLLSRVVQK